MLRDIGEILVLNANEMNIPVNCFLHFAEDRNLWLWSATNFMPRKLYCAGNYSLEATTKEEIMEYLNKHVTPLYKVAYENIKLMGENYYWE